MHEKMLNITDYLRNANQNYFEAPLHSGQNGTTSLWSEWQLLTSQINTGEGVEKREPSYTVGRNVDWYNHCRKQCGSTSEN